MQRPYVCVTCGVSAESATRGKLPQYCSDCKRKRQLVASRRWKDANAERVREYRATYDALPEQREITKARARRWRELNRDRIPAYRRALYEERQRDSNTETVRQYRAENPGKHAEIENRRRARKLEQFVEPVDAAEIRERDLGLCGICGLPVDVTEQSLDHIIPIALGGTHEPANVQLAHRVCNSRKGAKLLQA